MSASLTELLLPQVVLRVISRLKGGRGPLGNWLGWYPERFDKESVSLSGPNTITGTGSVRNYTYRIFDYTRVPMKGRAPGTGPATVAQNPMGQNTVSIARFHQKIPLNYEFLGNLSPMIGPNSQIDQGGQNYIGQQTAFLGKQANNMVEMMAAGMLRDSLYFIQSGDNWLPTFTAPVAPTVGFQIPFKIPSTSTGQGANQMGTGAAGSGNIITVPWDNVGAPIIGDLLKIKAAYAQLSQYSMTDVWINSLLWYNIITNTSVRNTAGSSNVPFAEYDKLPEGEGEGGAGAARYKYVLRGDPTVEWHSTDDTLALNTDIDPSYSSAPSTATLAKEVPDNLAIFCTRPARDWQALVHGGEYVVENPGQPGQLRMGYYFWHEYVTQPSAVELIALLNAVPALFVPAVVAPLQVAGFGP